jgi:glutamine amidotransferase
MNTIAVVDYGMGNLHSIAKALEQVADGARIEVTDDRRTLARADRVLFPGVGAIRDCMQALAARGLDQALTDACASRPVLGVCLGMQALFDFSEENGGTRGLGLLDGTVRHFAGVLRTAAPDLKIPHMGWNGVVPARDHPLWAGIAPGTRFYFVHSYYVEPAQHALTAASCDYGFAFAAAVARDNLFAVQFHPEKSQRAGLQLLANFVRWDGRTP